MPERGWRPPPPTGGEGELRLKKLAAAVAAIAALAERLYDPADPLAVGLGLDRERHEAAAHAIFRDMNAPLGAQIEASDEAAAPGDRVTAILQEAARTGESDLDLVFVKAELQRLALEQAGSPWAIRPGFGTPQSEEEFLHAIRRDVDLVALLSNAMASAAEAVWMRPDAASPRADRVASARARGHDIMRALPPGLWSAIDPLLDGLYREWRERALRDVAAGRRAWACGMAVGVRMGGSAPGCSRSMSAVAPRPRRAGRAGGRRARRLRGGRCSSSPRRRRRADRPPRPMSTASGGARTRRRACARRCRDAGGGSRPMRSTGASPRSTRASHGARRSWRRCAATSGGAPQCVTGRSGSRGAVAEFG